MPGYGRLAAEAAWREAAGPALAARCQVRLEAPGVLEVRVPDEHWRATVACLEPALLDSLRRRPGGEGLGRLHVRIDRGLPAPPPACAPPDPPEGLTGGSGERPGAEERLRRIARLALARRKEER